MQISYQALNAYQIDEACALAWDVFLKFEAPGLSSEGIEEFYQFLDVEYLIHRFGEGQIRFWGAFEGERMVGVCAFRDFSHICLLFVAGEYHRRGIGRGLLKRALIDLKKIDMDLDRITVHAAPGAVSFYSALGFVPMSLEVAQNGLRFVPMALFDKNSAKPG